MHNRCIIAILFFMLFFNTSFAQDSCFTQVLSFEDKVERFDKVIISNISDSIIILHTDYDLLYISYDRGESFIDISDLGLRGRFQLEGNTFYREYDKLYYMKDSVTNWIEVDLPEHFDHFAANDTLTQFTISDEAMVINTNDHGAYVFDNPFGYIQDMAVGENNELFVLTLDGYFYSSYDLGATWDSVNVDFHFRIDTDFVFRYINENELIFFNNLPPSYWISYSYFYRTNAEEDFTRVVDGNNYLHNIRRCSDGKLVFVYATGIYEKDSLTGDSTKITNFGFAHDATKIGDRYYFVDEEGLYSTDNCEDNKTDANYYPLEVGNKWMYYYDTGSIIEHRYGTYTSEVISDTIINDKRVAYLNNRGDGIYYDQSSQDLMEYHIFSNNFTYIGNFNNQHKTMMGNNLSYPQMRHEVRNVFDDPTDCRVFKYIDDSGSSSYYYAPDLGIVKETSVGGYGSNSSRKLVEAIIHDGDSVYHYHTDVKPEIRHNHDSLKIDSIFTFETEIYHRYATESSYYGKRACLDAFIDSAWIEMKYMNSFGDSICTEQELVFYDSTRVCHSLISLRTDLLTNGYECRYKIHAVDKALVPNHVVDPVEEYYTITQDDLTGIENTEHNSSLVYKYELYQNYPNPFNAKTVIAFDIPSSGEVRLRIYDLLGRVVAEPVNEVKSPGSYEVLFNADELASGMYFYELKTDTNNDIKKMILLK